MNCVVIDDEPLARECIRDYVNQVDFLKLAGEGANPMELEKVMRNNSIDLVFMDIQMPVITGIDYLKSKKLSPLVILTTAYPSYALEGYELDIVDYLLKPITFNRFFQGVSKAREINALRNQTYPENYGDQASFFIKCNKKYEKIICEEIRFIQAQQNYVNIFTTTSKYMTLMSMKHIEERLDRESFVRIHKSYIVNLKHVSVIDDNEIIMGEHRIPISRQLRKEVMSRVLKDKLI